MPTTPPTEHFNHYGVNTSLRFVGCIDCATESGAAHACCDGLRCAECDARHHSVAAECVKVNLL